MNGSCLVLCSLLATSMTARAADWSWIIDWKPALIQAATSPSGVWIPPDHPYLQVSGRVTRNAQNKLRLIWPGTTLKGRFSGRSLAVQLEDDGRTDYQVIIDGDLMDSRLLDTAPGFHVYPLAQNLQAGEHTFELFRRTETFSGFTQVDGFFLDAGANLMPWNAPRPLQIDFYGDSQTVGACNECGPTEQWDDLRQHNHLLSYGALAARMLGAETQMTAVSGIGLTQGYQDYTMDQIWNRVAPDPASEVYEPRDRQPDVIVVNLGQNDFSLNVRDSFAPAYRAFIQKLRTRHPKAWIICALGAMSSAHDPASPYPGYVKEAVEAQHDPKILSFIFKTRTWEHPRVPEHLQMADELVNFLKANLKL